MTISLIFAHSILGHGQDRFSIAADLASAICMQKIRIWAEHSFCSHWSAGMETTFNLSKICKGASEMESQHWSELYGEQRQKPQISAEGLSDNEVFISYWPGGAFKGPLIGIGGMVKERGNPDLNINIGYSCTVWKRMRAVFLYKIGLAEYIATSKLSADGILIGLSYVF